MKNFWKVLGIIALVAVIGFLMAACNTVGNNAEPNPFEGTWEGGPYNPGNSSFTVIRFVFTSTTYEAYGDGAVIGGTNRGDNVPLGEGGSYTYKGNNANFRSGGLSGNQASIKGDVLSVQGMGTLELRKK